MVPGQYGDVEVRGLRGSYEELPIEGRPVRWEAFAISTINEPTGPWTGPDGGAMIRDWLVHECCPNSYCSGISMGYRPKGRPIVPSVVERCSARGLTDNWFAFSACDATTFRDCDASGCRLGFYNDTDGVDGWSIDRGAGAEAGSITAN